MEIRNKKIGSLVASFLLVFGGGWAVQAQAGDSVFASEGVMMVAEVSSANTFNLNLKKVKDPNAPPPPPKAIKVIKGVNDTKLNIPPPPPKKLN